MNILEITENLIVVDNGKKDVEINKLAFESWIDNSDKRSFIEDWSEAGEHRQISGVIDWEDYYGSHYLNSDIKEYLIVREAKTGKLKDMPDMAGSLKKLLHQINQPA